MTTVKLTIKKKDLDALTQALHDFQQSRADYLKTAEPQDKAFIAELLEEYQAAHRLWLIAREAEQ